MNQQNENPPIKHPNNFIDPYGHIPRKDKGRTTIDVSLDCRSHLNSVYPKKGVLQTTINILLEKLRNELYKHGITTYSPDVFECAVGNCHLTLGGIDSEQQSIPGKPVRKSTRKSKSNPT